MKLKKVLSTAAAVAVAGVVSVSASANFFPVTDPVGGVSCGTGLYMTPIFCNAETDDIPMTDYQLDLSKIGYASFTITIPEKNSKGEDNREFFDGNFGGAVGISLHASTIDKEHEKWGLYNWDSANEQGAFWGVIDNGAKDPNSYDVDGEYIEGMPKTIAYQDQTGQPTFLETLAPYTYRVKAPLVNPVVDGVCKAEDITDIRIFLQGWSGSWSFWEAEVTRAVLYDTDGKVMIAFDGKGNKVDATADDEKEPVMPTLPVEDPVESAATSDNASAATSDNASAATSDTASAATSNTTSAGTSSAPTSSSAAASSSSSSEGGLPTGAIVGIIAGVVVVVVVVVVIVVKKKKG